MVNIATIACSVLWILWWNSTITCGEFNFQAACRALGVFHRVDIPFGNETLQACAFIIPGGVRLTSWAAVVLPAGSICAVETAEWSHQRRWSCFVLWHHFTTKHNDQEVNCRKSEIYLNQRSAIPLSHSPFMCPWKFHETNYDWSSIQHPLQTA